MSRRSEEFLHKKSLVLGRMFRAVYFSHGMENRVTQMLLGCYRSARREMPGGIDDSGHSTRYGAYEAYEATQQVSDRVYTSHVESQEWAGEI